jgi:hypothetical protein
LERLPPSAVVHHQVRPDVCGHGEGSQRGVRLRCSDHEHPKERPRLGTGGRRRRRRIGAVVQANQRDRRHGDDRGPDCRDPRWVHPAGRRAIRAKPADTVPEVACECSQLYTVLTEPARASRRGPPVARGATGISQSRDASPPFASPLSQDLCALAAAPARPDGTRLLRRGGLPAASPDGRCPHAGSRRTRRARSGGTS